MTKADAAKLVAIVVTAYPNYDKFRDAAEVEATVNLWAAMFHEDPGGIVGLAVRKHIATNKWPPSVAEIRELMLEAQHPELVPPDQAWAAVSDLLYSVGEYNYGALNRQLPPLIARAVEVIGWGNLWAMHCSYARGGKPGLDRVAFLDQYRPMYEREKARAMTPPAITSGIGTALAALPDGSQKLLADREAGRREKEEEYRQLTERNRRATEEALRRFEEEKEAERAEWRKTHKDDVDIEELKANPAGYVLKRLRKGETT